MHTTRQHIVLIALMTIVILTAASCSSTSALEDGEVLYTGMKKISYVTTEKNEHTTNTKAEVEAALACAPNGALFGSPYYRRPLAMGLWIWNKYSDKDTKMAKWLTSSFGTPPIVIDEVNPELRTTVATTLLQSNGFFRGTTDYELIYGKTGTTRTDTVPRPLTAKIAYHVNMGPLYTLDSIAYRGFNDKEQALLSKTTPLIKRGDPFNVNKLDAERERINNIFRENGYFYSNTSYMHYLADTIQKPGQVQLLFTMADSVAEGARNQWKIGNTIFKIRRSHDEELTDTTKRRSLTVMYNGKRSPLRSRVILQDMRQRRGELYSESAFNETKARLGAKGIFSSLDISCTPTSTPAESPDSIGSLTMLVDCVMEQPYSLSLSSNYTYKTSGRGGPGVGIGITKNNAFRGGEKLSVDLNGSTDFRIGHTTEEDAASYDLGADITLEMPKLLIPKFLNKRRGWYNTPSTVIRVSAQTINRSGFFRRNIFSSELLYNFQRKETIRHTFSPLTIDYSQLSYMSESYEEKMRQTIYGNIMLEDNLIPKMRYTFQYNSPSSYRNPIQTTFTIIESGTLLNALSSLGSQTWSEKDKKIFKVAFSQFIKAEVDWRKIWTVGMSSSLVAHSFAGFMQPFGNSSVSPFSEMYYVGGANDLRGFPARGLGPGNIYYEDKQNQYGACNANLKLECNLEYRFPLVSMFHGALFVDAGNVWLTSDEELMEGESDKALFSLHYLPETVAVSAGVGLRVDLKFFVIRLDWGFIVHAPYDTGRSGYFNNPSFKKGQSLNFAIGYPF